MSRTSKNWKCLPGSFDTTHTIRQIFPSKNKMGIPDMLLNRKEPDITLKLMGYKTRDDTGEQQQQAICHFFLDDYHFESIWRFPDRSLSRVSRFAATLTPDFSIYTGWPAAIGIWNTYRSHWLGRYWQEQGYIVIPTVNWSTPASYDWCFMGIPTNTILALAVPNKGREQTIHYFKEGFREMLRRLRPYGLLVYGELPFKCSIAVEHKPEWTKLKQLGEQ